MVPSARRKSAGPGEGARGALILAPEEHETRRQPSARLIVLDPAGRDREPGVTATPRRAATSRVTAVKPAATHCSASGAVTPRCAPTATEEQRGSGTAGRREHPGHGAEAEIDLGAVRTAAGCEPAAASRETALAPAIRRGRPVPRVAWSWLALAFRDLIWSSDMGRMRMMVPPLPPCRIRS